MAKNKLITSVTQNWHVILIALIVMIGTWLRVYQLPKLGIFFPDAARDLLVARDAIDHKYLPLLGIPSSIPRLKQGPISIWLEMLVLAVAGDKLWVVAIFFASLNVAAIVLVYELMVTRVSKWSAITSSWLLATSPLAIAGARVPYHTNLLPLATILFIYASVRAAENKRHSTLILGIAWSFLFQFELAMAGTFLVLIYLGWINRRRWTKIDWLKLVAGLGFGLTPQIIFDLQNSGKQLGGFALWIAYRLGSFVGIWPEHTASAAKLMNYLNTLLLYLPRIFGVIYPKGAIAILMITFITLGLVLKNIGWSKLNPAYQITWLISVSLLLTYALHSAPSEAYFPPFVVLFPILFSSWLTMWPRQKIMWLGLFLIVGVTNIFFVINHHFFVDNQQSFSYGLSTQSQKMLVQQAAKITGDSFYLVEDEPGSANHWRWQMRELDLQEEKTIGVHFDDQTKQITLYDFAK